MSGNAQSPLRGIGSMATRRALDELCAEYAQRAQQPVEAVAVGGVDAAQRLRNGEPFDFTVLAADAIERLAAEGHVDARSRVDIARSAMAIAVAAGAPHPDIRTEQSLREAVLRARSVGYSTGPSGAHFMQLLQRWGIANDVTARLTRAQPGVPVAALIARGEVELGFQQRSELQDMPGVHVVGPLPPEAQLVTVFSGARCTVSMRHADTAALLAFLGSRDGDAIKRRHGLEPAHPAGTA